MEKLRFPTACPHSALSRPQPHRFCNNDSSERQRLQPAPGLLRHPRKSGYGTLRPIAVGIPRPIARNNTPAHTDELFESNSRREAEARLHHLIELKCIGLMTGEVGSGKTTVCRHVAAALHPGLHRVGYVSLTTGNVLDMYKAIAWELGVKRHPDLRTNPSLPPFG